MRRCGQLARTLLVTLSISGILITIYMNNVRDASWSYRIPEAQSIPTPVIYIVTPTYSRATQMADMTRLAQTLRLVPNIHWLVIEDAVRLTKQLARLLNESKISHTHILGPTPANKKLKKFGKGVASRRKALELVRSKASDGVLYFADDDNAYDIRIFEEMRFTEKVSVWPVGLIFGFGMSTPVVRDGKVVGFHDSFIRKRVFAMDMAGFAVSVELLHKFPNATMVHELGYLEDSFLRSLNISLADLEPKANNCTEVLVWHTRTVPVPKPKVQDLKKVKNYQKSNLLGLYRNLLNKW